MIFEKGAGFFGACPANGRNPQSNLHSNSKFPKSFFSVDLPLSHECKRVLAYAAEEAERLSHKHIGTEHLLLGLLREEKSFAAEILNERGSQASSDQRGVGALADRPTAAFLIASPRLGSLPQ